MHSLVIDQVDIVHLKPGEAPPATGHWVIVIKTPGQDFEVIGSLRSDTGLLALGTTTVLAEALDSAKRAAHELRISAVYTIGVTEVFH